MSSLYSGASQSQRFDDTFRGSYVPGFPARGVLHTTETTSWPSYSGGAVAPQFTVNPKTGQVRQHFPITMPGRALQHPPGTVDTNNAHAIQIEIIAYSDNAIAKKVGGLRVDSLTPAQLKPIADLMRWIEANAGVERTAHGLDFKSYPSSAGTNNGVRMSTARWRTFDGWCGHSHVPNNDHGDPSDIDIAALLYVPPPPPAPKMEDRDVMYLIGVQGKSAKFLCVNNSDLHWVHDQDHQSRINLMYEFLFGDPVHEITATSPEPLMDGKYGLLKGPSPSEILPGETAPRELGWVFPFRQPMSPTPASTGN